ncbi:hypothetical protein [Mesorhizobium sp. f-mel]
MASTMPSDTDRPFRGKRLSWREFYSIRPDLRPANDNTCGISPPQSRVNLKRTDVGLGENMAKRSKRSRSKRQIKVATLGKVKTVIRSRPRSAFLNPALAEYREGAKSEPPTGPIVRNSGQVDHNESDWFRDTSGE